MSTSTKQPGYTTTETTLMTLIGFGMVLILIGTIIAMFTWPEAVMEYDMELGEEIEAMDGNWFGVIVGVCAGVAGQVMLTIGIIAYAVRLGVASG